MNWKSSIWLAALVGYVLVGLWFVPFHGDESTQIYMSRDYAYTFLERDLSRVFFAEPPASPQEQELRIINGTVNKYTIGAAWHTAGMSINDVNQQWDWGAPYDYNVQTGHHPGERLLTVARVPSALFTAAGVIVAFLIGRRLGGAWTAYLASLFYAVDPAVLVNGRRAMMEGSLLFGGLLVVLAGIHFLTTTRRWRGAILLGAAAGFALAAKHTNVFTVGAVFIACAAYVIWQRTTARAIVSLMGAGVLAGVVFLALNPAWWANPIATAGAILDLRTNLLQIQTDVFGSYPGIGAQLGGFWRQVIVGAPMYYEVPGWGDYIGEQIRQYERWGLAGLRLPGVIYAALVIAGFAALVPQSSEQTHPARWVVGVWVVLVSGLTLLLTPLEWQRYYLPAVPGIALVAAHGTAVIIQFLLAIKRNPREPHTV